MERTAWEALHGHPPTIIHEEDREKCYAALEVWDIRQDLAPLREFSEGRRKKRRRRGLCVRGVPVRVFLFVLPSSYSITPPVGEGGSLQQMVSGDKQI